MIFFFYFHNDNINFHPSQNFEFQTVFTFSIFVQHIDFIDIKRKEMFHSFF